MSQRIRRLIGSCLCTRSCVLFCRRWGSESISGKKKNGSEKAMSHSFDSVCLWFKPGSTNLLLQHQCVMPYLCHLLIHSLTSFSLVLQLSARGRSLFRFIILLIGRTLLQFLVIFFARNFLQLMSLGSCSS